MPSIKHKTSALGTPFLWVISALSRGPLLSVTNRTLAMTILALWCQDGKFFKYWNLLKTKKETCIRMVKMRVAAFQPPPQGGEKTPTIYQSYHHQAPSSFVTFQEWAAEARLWGKRRGVVLTSVNSWQVTTESSVSLRSHYKTSTLKIWLSSFPWSSVWAAGVSAPVVTANAAWQEQEAQEFLTCFWRFSKMNQLFCIFLPRYSTRNKNFAHPISQTWQLWQFYCSVLLKHSHRFT